MASFNSALAIFILVLFSGCFTLPLNQLNDLSTIESQFISTTETNEHMGFDVSTSVFTSSDNGKREFIDAVSTPIDESTTGMTEPQESGKRDFEDSFSTSVYEPTTEMGEQQGSGKRAFEDLFSTTEMTEQQESGKRAFEDLYSTTEMNEQQESGKRAFEDLFSTTEMTEQQENGERAFEDSVSTTEMNEQQGSGKRAFEDSVSTTEMNEQQESDKRAFEDLFSTTEMNEQQESGKRAFEDSVSTTEMTEQQESDKRVFEDLYSTTEMSEQQENGKREMEIEPTTNNLFLSTSTSSKGKKYTGLLSNDNEKQEGSVSEEGQNLESEVKSTKTTENVKPIQKSKTNSGEQSSNSFPSENKAEQGSTEPMPRFALFDQSASDSVLPNLNGDMTLDDYSSMVVTDFSTVLATSANKIGKSEVPLNQGKESLYN